MEQPQIKNLIQKIPNNPGCYLFYNANDKIIYVGKAQNLHKRVQSYFVNKKRTNKQIKFIQSIFNIKYYETKDNTEAMLLEANLIKKNKPYYNVVLTDDRRYPYIVITNEPYPRLIYKYNLNKNNKHYFGPFPDGYSAYQILKILNQIYPFRKCIHMPKKSCIYYDIKQCLAPCINKIDPKKYLVMIKEIKDFFNKDNKKVLEHLNHLMDNYSKNLQFEQALNIKNLIQKIKLYNNKQTIIFEDKISRDVISFVYKNNYLSCSILFYVNGALSHKKNWFKFIYDENDVLKEIFNYLLNLYNEQDIPEQLVTTIGTNNFPNELSNKFKIINPKQGKNFEMIKLAKSQAESNWEIWIIKALKNEKTLIKLTNQFNALFPKVQTIDIIDNSFNQTNIFISSLLRFSKFKSSPKLYRKYNLSNITDLNNDYEGMKWIINKIYGKTPSFGYCDLLILDGGKIQVNAAKEIKAKYNLPFEICGLVKNEHHKTERICLENLEIKDLNEFPELKLYFSNIQEKIHNFAINYFRQKNYQILTKTKLTNITGIGKNRERQLIEYFQSYEAIKKAKLEELKNILSNNLAQNVYNYFHNSK